jgi:hypothetical protein
LPLVDTIGARHNRLAHPGSGSPVRFRCAGFVILRGSKILMTLKNMIETNPILFRIQDLSARVAQLRGYL